MSRTVQIRRGWPFGVEVPATTVTVDDDGRVTWQGERIGYVWKGHRMYSPPTHKGSRIVKYHKKVPEWQGHTRRSHPPAEYRCDSRQEVIQRLIAARLEVGR